MPQASYQYKFSQQKSLRVEYRGSSEQPGLDQIQPVRENTDPLNISLGNPELRPSFRSNISLNYNAYKVLTSQYVWLNGSYGLTSNPIVSDVTTDAMTGKSTIRSVNMPDKAASYFYFSADMSRKIKALDMSVGLNFGANGNSSYNYINSELNNTKRYSYKADLIFSKYVAKKYNFSSRFGPRYDVSRASINKLGDSDGWGLNGNFEMGVTLPAKFEMKSDARYEYKGRTQTFNETFERLLWNVSLTKKFFKAENLQLAFTVNDLLNQNIGFDRSAYNGNINQSSYTTIKRYAMFSLSWDFNKMGGSTKTQK